MSTSKTIILVTGGAGHVGSHVVEQLVANPDNHVISLDNYFTGREENHIPGAEYRKGDTNDIDTLIPESPAVIYHLGEYARIAPSFDEPQKVFTMNTLGTVAVLEFCRKKNAKLVYSGSSTKFADDGQGRHKNPYAFSKATNVDLIKDYGDWFGLRYAIAYFNNAFGPREARTGKYSTLIGKFEATYLAGQPFTVVKPGTQKRNFTYVGDLAKGIIVVGERGEGDGYVLGNPKAFSVLQIAEAFGGPVQLIDGYPGRAESGETPKKAWDELGWRPTIDILDYIKQFVAAHPRAK